MVWTKRGSLAHLVEADEDVRLFEADGRVGEVGEGGLDGAAGLRAVDDLERFDLHLVVLGLQRVVVEAVADEGDAVVVEVEIAPLVGAPQGVGDLLVHRVGGAEVAADVAVEEAVAVAPHQPRELRHGHLADEHPRVVEVFDDGAPGELEGLLDGLGRLEHLDDAVVVDVLEADAVGEVLAVDDVLRLGALPRRPVVA